MAAHAEFHVLAVDDSLVDRMLIERLLKTSSFHGNVNFLLCTFLSLFVKYNMNLDSNTAK